MTEISRSALFGRLNPTALKAIETATGFCKMRGNPYVELVHWVHILLQDARNDVAAIRSTKCSPSGVRAPLSRRRSSAPSVQSRYCR